MWSKFDKLFYTYFFSINTVTEAINKLEETTYYQDSYTVENYLNKFQYLILEVNYTNLYTIVVKFHQGL